jgi:hypothetical protein
VSNLALKACKVVRPPRLQIDKDRFLFCCQLQICQSGLQCSVRSGGGRRASIDEPATARHGHTGFNSQTALWDAAMGFPDSKPASLCCDLKSRLSVFQDVGLRTPSVGPATG